MKHNVSLISLSNKNLKLKIEIYIYIYIYAPSFRLTLFLLLLCSFVKVKLEFFTNVSLQKISFGLDFDWTFVYKKSYPEFLGETWTNSGPVWLIFLLETVVHFHVYKSMVVRSIFLPLFLQNVTKVHF